MMDIANELAIAEAMVFPPLAAVGLLSIWNDPLPGRLRRPFQRSGVTLCIPHPPAMSLANSFAQGLLNQGTCRPKSVYCSLCIWRQDWDSNPGDLRRSVPLARGCNKPLYHLACNWRAIEDSNLEPTVLETATLPIELMTLKLGRV